MSQIFSFRLDENNPREAQAIQVIEAWASRGYALRFVLVEALLSLEAKSQQGDYSSELKLIIGLLQELKAQPAIVKSQPNQEKRLSESFLNAITQVNRPGLRVEKNS